MRIEIVDIVRSDVPNKNGKGTYGVLNVAYRSDGKVQEKKIMSFANPSVFKHIEGLKKGDTVNVKSEKQGDYWQWTAIEADNGITSSSNQVSSEPAKTGNAGGATRVTGSTYATAEERAIVQRYIIRQSSLAQAVATLAISMKAPKESDVITLANKYVAWVTQPDAPVSIGENSESFPKEFDNDMPDFDSDVPN